MPGQNILFHLPGILNQNQVQIISGNSAGLITVVQGSGVTQQDKEDIIDGVWDELLSGHTIAGSAAKILSDISYDTGTSLATALTTIDSKIDTIDAVVDIIEKLTGNDVTKDGSIITIYEADGTTPWRQYDLSNGGRIQA